MLKQTEQKRKGKTLADFDRMALNLFLSLSMQAVIKQKFKEDEGILKEWAEDQIAQSASYIFPVPFEA